MQLRDPQEHDRRSIRLAYYDYATSAAYFVTLCVAGQQCLLGSVENGEFIESAFGRIAREGWLWLERTYPYVKHDAWSLMPNHLHGIICLLPVAAERKALGQLLGAFKTTSTKKINELRHTPQAGFWQRNYYEHVIRDDKDLEGCRAYIEFNQRQWNLDHCRVQPYTWE